MPKNAGSKSPTPSTKPPVRVVARAGDVRVGVVQVGQIPAAVIGEFGDDVAAFEHHVPQVFRRVDSTRITAGHTHDRDLIVSGDPHRGDVLDFLRHTREFGPEIRSEPARCRVVEDQRRRKRQPGGCFEPVAHFNGGQRVKAQLLKRLVRVDRLRSGIAQHGLRCASAPDPAAPRPARLRAGRGCVAPEPTWTCWRPASRRPADGPAHRPDRRTSVGPRRRWARRAAVSMWAGSRNGPSTTIAVSNSCSASTDESAFTPVRASRARPASSSPPVISLAWSHRPQPSDIAGRPCARRCTASASRKLLAAA